MKPFGRKKISPFLSDHKDDLEPVPSRKQQVVLNPLSMFPSRRDPLTTGLFDVNLKVPPSMLSRTVEDDRWLNPEKIDPEFGITGYSREIMLRRSFRRVASSQVFMPMQPSDIKLTELHRPKLGDNRKFVVVEESRLRELTNLENVLREEKEKLGSQCVSILDETKSTARIPVPAMRLAVHNICEGRMREAAKKLTTLYEEWCEHSRKNGYNRGHVYLTKSFAKSAPLAERTLKLKLTKDAAKGWRVRYEQDNMLFEDSLGHVMRDYVEAQYRRRDYDRYFILATRYGVFSDAEFSLDASPGDRYFKKANGAALMLQKRWALYWPMKKLRMHRAARFMQTLFRRHYAYNKWHPIIVLRMKYGKRTYYRFCLMRWKEYNNLCVKIRTAIAYQLSTYVRLCFGSWKTHWMTEKKERLGKMSRFLLRAKAGSLFGFFMKWTRYIAYSKRVLRTARRIVQNPHFLLWLEYAKNRKAKRIRHLATARIQAMYRGRKDRLHYAKLKVAKKHIFYFALRVLAKRRVNWARVRDQEEGFLKWWPVELAARHHKAVEKERRRLISCQQTVHDKEAAAIADLRRHLRTKNGKMQIKYIIDQKKNAKVRRKAVHQIDIKDLSALNEKKSMFRCLPASNSDRYNSLQVREDLTQQCSNTMRLMGVHDFNARSPPLYKCIVPSCNTYFVSIDQYTKHMEHPAHHSPLPVEMAEFHALVKSPKTQELLRKHFGVNYGINTQINCLDLWTCIQDWRRVTIKTESYVHKAGQFYEAHVRPSCPRPADLVFDELKELHEKMAIVLKREYEGFYRLNVSKKGFFQRMLGIDGRNFEEWTTENIIPPELFNILEYHCFRRLFELYQQPSFQNSDEGRALVALKQQEKIEQRNADFQLYLTLRNENFRAWVLDFKITENQLNTEAVMSSSVIFDQIIEKFLSVMLSVEVQDESRLLGYKEQVVHEQSNMVTEEAELWAEDLILDAVYEFYSESIVRAMWDKPDCRKTLMEFAGFLEPRKKLLLSKRKNVSNDWFNEYLNDVMHDDKGSMGLDTDSAAKKIQKIARGRIGRRKAKKIFVHSFGKRLDKASGASYYVNLNTGTTSWDRPVMAKYLLPKNSTW